MSDLTNVDHPIHYKSGEYECLDVMVDVFGTEKTATFCLLNAFKYLWRHEAKSGREDIQKAGWYVRKYLDLMGEKE